MPSATTPTDSALNVVPHASAKSDGLRDSANCANRIIAVTERPIRTAPPYNVTKPGNVPITCREKGAAAIATTPRDAIVTRAARRCCGVAGSVARSSTGEFTSP